LTMKMPVKVLCTFIILFCTAILCSSFEKNSGAGPAKFAFPYRQAGLTERQAAAHLLSRFTYGAKPGDVDAVVKMGLENWFMQQLDGREEDGGLDQMLGKFDAINLSNSEIEDKYPRTAKVLKMAIRDGSIQKDSVNKSDQKAYRKQIQEYMQAHNLKPQQELYRQFINQKILRAAFTRNQLREVLTDFWFNHFNVSLTKNRCAPFIPAFERDVIRPNVTGKFGPLLLSTAKSPAMLIYLDNFSSSGSPDFGEINNVETEMQVRRILKKQQANKNKGGLNENYAREVMELHTLGVDGGYTQNDVTQAARVLTGWTVVPDGNYRFVPSRHDHGEKIVLAKKFSAGGGYEEGVALLDMLAHHPSTAKFISKKLAARFVSDLPPQELVDRMARTFSSTDGDIKQVMITMAASAEFWTREALREKTKSPFELAVSAVRSLDARITQPYQLFTWINKMGQKMYYYQAPTGFPDRGQYWINTGSLLSRMNFGLALATARIPGIQIDLKKLNNNHEPESAEAALQIYSRLMLPERSLNETIKRLKPMLTAPDLAEKVSKAVQTSTLTGAKGTMSNEDTFLTNKGTEDMLAQVVGIIIGSPEFQRK